MNANNSNQQKSNLTTNVAAVATVAAPRNHAVVVFGTKIVNYFILYMKWQLTTLRHQ